MTLFTHLSPRPLLETVVSRAAKHFAEDASGWGEARRCDGMGRAVAAYLARIPRAAPGHEIATRLGCRNVSSVSGACRRLRAATRDRRFARSWTDIANRRDASH